MPRLYKYHCWKSPLRRNYTDNYALRITNYELNSLLLTFDALLLFYDVKSHHIFASTKTNNV